MKRLLSFGLALCIIMSCVFCANFTTVAASVDSAATSASTGPQTSIQGSAILHCFNWSYNNIKNNLQAIKDAGYTAVQTSPVQTPKDYNPSWSDQGGQWWKLYQPLNFAISNNTWLGTKNDLKSLCDTAESMGIKVVVDVVANHVSGTTGGGGYGALDGAVDGSLKRWEYYHDYHNGATDNNRYEMTMGHIGMPDLNTGHGDVQRIVKNFLIECINVGVDGFRFDAAKHIELPTDDGNRSDFWPTVINGSQSAASKEIYYYGEILNGCGTNINNYTKYMSITDNYSSDAVLMAVCNGNAAGMANSNYAKGAAPNKNVLWVESHDTFMGESGSAGMGNTSRVSDDKIIKAWAIIASRADASALYFARSAHSMGAASTNTSWKSKPVAEVNKFKNYFDGQTEFLSHDGSIAYNERGTSGVVLVNANGGSCSVNVRANKIANGTYKDAVSGGTFTVSNGRITGNIGDSGVAVVYNPTNTPTPIPTQPSTQKPTETQPPTQPQSQYLIGDIDLDGEITILDATAVQQHISELTVLTGKSFRAADIDLDGSVAVTDATLIQLYLINTIPSGSYCGKFVTGSNIVEPTEKPSPQPVGNYVYFNNFNNWNNVNIYYWSDSNTGMTSWPGVKMNVYQGSVYCAEIPDGVSYVIFNNGSDQTGDLRFEGVNKIFDNGSWRNYNGSSNTPINPQPTTSPVGDNKYIYFKNNDNWGEVKVYYWSESNSNMTSWPGQHMESVGNNVYRTEIPSDATMVVFNNNQGAQTSDIRLEGLGKIYNNGSWSTYNG